MWRHLVNWLLNLLPPTHFFALRRALLRSARIELGENARICGHGWIYGRGSLAIGADAWLSPGTVIYTHENAHIAICKNCDIGPYCFVLTGGHEIAGADRRAGTGTATSVRIGDGCFIGAKSTILGGTSIGSGCVVAAGSLVRGEIPDNSFVAGVPAVVKSELER